jgi:hypothetical protein
MVVAFCLHSYLFANLLVPERSHIFRLKARKATVMDSGENLKVKMGTFRLW